MASRSDIAVREATRADLLAVFRIEKRSFPQPWPYAAFEQFLGDPGFLVAERSETVVGYVIADVLSDHGTPIGHVKDIAIAPEHRGEGVGSLLLSSALATLSTRGVGWVKLEVRPSNDAAIALYRQFDFERSHRIPGYYDDGEDAVIMVRG